MGDMGGMGGGGMPAAQRDLLALFARAELMTQQVCSMGFALDTARQAVYAAGSSLEAALSAATRQVSEQERELQEAALLQQEGTAAGGVEQFEWEADDGATWRPYGPELSRAIARGCATPSVMQVDVGDGRYVDVSERAVLWQRVNGQPQRRRRVRRTPSGAQPSLGMPRSLEEARGHAAAEPAEREPEREPEPELDAALRVPEVCMSWAWLDDTGERHRYNAVMCEELERALAEGRTHVEVDAQRVVDLGQMRQVHSFAIAIC